MSPLKFQEGYGTADKDKLIALNATVAIDVSALCVPVQILDMEQSGGDKESREGQRISSGDQIKSSSSERHEDEKTVEEDDNVFTEYQ